MGDGLEPVGLAIVVCDAIHTDPATGKRSLLGLFSVIFGREFPLKVPAMAVYVSLTECRGKFPVILQIIDVNENREAVSRVEGEVEFDNPLGMLEIDFRLGELQFPEPGEYRVQLYAAGEPIIERRIVIAPLPAMEQNDEE